MPVYPGRYPDHRFLWSVGAAQQSQCDDKGMPEWLTPLLLVVAYVVVMKFVLPKLGVPT